MLVLFVSNLCLFVFFCAIIRPGCELLCESNIFTVWHKARQSSCLHCSQTTSDKCFQLYTEFKGLQGIQQERESEKKSSLVKVKALLSPTADGGLDTERHRKGAHCVTADGKRRQRHTVSWARGCMMTQRGAGITFGWGTAPPNTNQLSAQRLLGERLTFDLALLVPKLNFLVSNL